MFWIMCASSRGRATSGNTALHGVLDDDLQKHSKITLLRTLGESWARPEGSEARHGHCSVTRLETLESYKLSCTCFKALFISPLDTLGRVVKFLNPTESIHHV